MGLAITTLIDGILVFAALIAALGILAGVTSAVVGMDFSCRISVTLVRLGIGNGLHCSIQEDSVPARDFKNPSDKAAQAYIGKSMLQCWNTFGNGRIESVLDQSRLSIGGVPDILSQGAFLKGRWARGQFKPALYCHVCSIINVSQPVSGMKDFLENAQVGKTTYAQRLYPDAPRLDRYAPMNSASYTPKSVKEPDTAYIVYVEGSLNGVSANGVIEMNEADFEKSIGSTDRTKNICGRYI